VYEITSSFNETFSSRKILSQTWDNIVESRNIVDGEETFVLVGLTGWMAKFDDEDWSFLDGSVVWMIEIEGGVCSEDSDAF